jgi:serine/threonine protein kinase
MGALLISGDLGLVVGFVLGMWPLQPSGTWKIADCIQQRGANTKMIQWLPEVERYKLRISNKYSLLHSMLARDPNNRITASDLVKRLVAARLRVKSLLGSSFSSMTSSWLLSMNGRQCTYLGYKI